MKAANLFETRAAAGSEEFLELVRTPGVRIEQIVSHGQAPSEWYDQAWAEWVVLLAGGARLVFDDGTARELRAGDHLVIPPHRRHRVEWCSADARWLAVHYPAEPGN